MKRVPARASYLPVVASGGVMSDLFSGRNVESVSGLDLPLTHKRGYRRLFHGDRVYRPGAYSPRTTRASLPIYGPQSVGTTTVIGALDAMNARNEQFGVAGSRAAWGKHVPKTAGLMGARVSMLHTPAYGVLLSGYARTGIPVLYSKFASPYGQVPNGLTRFDPIPARSHASLGALIPFPTPVGCLPGTPGCFADASGVIPAGVRKPWWLTQNEGQASSPILPWWDAPVLPNPSKTGSPLFDQYPTQIALPVNAPGSIHSINSSGGPSYLTAPGYPRYTSPWGYKGSTSRTPAEPVQNSGHDVHPWHHRVGGGRGLVLAAVVVGGVLLLSRRKK